MGLGGNWRFLVLMAAPIFLLPLLIVNDEPSITEKTTTKLKCAYVILLMATYWTLQILPLPVTAFLPIVLLPLLGVQDTSKVSYSYMGESNMMFISAMILALAAHKSGLTRRVALIFTNMLGTSQYMLVMSVGLMTFMVSIGWTNPGAALLMLHIVDTLIALLRQGRRMYTQSNISMISVISIDNHIDKQIPSPIEMNGDKLNDIGSLDSLDDVAEEEENDGESKLRQILLFTVLFSSNLGSAILPFGSSPQHSLYAYTHTQYTQSISIGKKNETGLLDYTDYGSWLWVVAPPLIVTFILGLGVLVLDGGCSLRPKRAGVFDLGGGGGDLTGYLHSQKDLAGSLTWHEFAVLILWFLCGILWVFKDPGTWMEGWGGIFKDMVGNSTSGMLIVFLLFVVPRGFDGDDVLEPLLGWKYVESGLPWGVVLVVGGGKAVADAAVHSGLVSWISQEFVLLDGLLGGGSAGYLIIALLIIAFFSEIVGGTTAAPILIPALINKGSLALACTAQASWIFNGPVATPASALLILAKGGLRGPKTGLILTPIAILTLFIANIIIPQPLLIVS